MFKSSAKGSTPKNSERMTPLVSGGRFGVGGRGAEVGGVPAEGGPESIPLSGPEA